MIVIKDAIYVRNTRGYVKCDLHKAKVKDKDTYSLVETKATISALPKDYAVMTLPEIVAKYGRAAIDDDKSAVSTEV